MTWIPRAVSLRARLRLLLLALLLVGLPPLAAAQEGLVIRQLRFQGNKSIDRVTLANAIETTKSSAFATLPIIRALGLGTKRYLRERALERDVERIRLLYRITGYLEVHVDTLIRRTATDAYITFRITEGRPVLLTRLVIEGVDSLPLPDPQRLLEDLPIQEGDVFNRALLRVAADTLADRLRERGYPMAAVFLADRVVDSAAYRVEIALDVEAGRRMDIGSIRVEADVPGDSSLVREFLTTRPGRRYRHSDLIRSQNNLAFSDLFRFVTVEIDSTNFTPESEALPLVVRVARGSKQRVAASAGYGTYDCFRGSLGWTGRNVLGRGRIVDLSSRFSKIGVGSPTDWGLSQNALCGRLLEDSIGSSRLNYTMSASLRRPGLLGPNSSGLFTVFAERGSVFDVYAREEVGASVHLTRETTRRIPLTLGYRLAYGQTFADDANFCAYFNACNQNDVRVLRERRRRGTLTLTLSRLLVNNPLDPSRGSSMGLQLAYSGSPTSSQEFQRFTRVTGDAAFYYPLARNLVLATRLRAGFLASPTVDFGAGGAGRVPYAPPDQRFYAGGPNDVRGFDGNQLGPLVYVFFDRRPFDSIPEPDTVMTPNRGLTVSPTGGNRMVIGSVEIRFPAPIFTGWKMAAFLDAGSVWEDRPMQAVPIRIRATPGLGLRVPTPLGPARVDVAYNPFGLPDGDLFWFASDGRLVRIVPNIPAPSRTRFTFHFAIGQAF